MNFYTKIIAGMAGLIVFALVMMFFWPDPGTAELGGELGWFRRGQMARQFEAVAFRLRPGQISNLVESPFGLHIIQVLRIEPAEVRARHVLFTPTVTEEDRAAARVLASAVAQALRDGAPLDSLTRLHHNEIDQPLFDQVARTDLPETYVSALAGAEPGDIIAPIEVTVGGALRYAVVVFEATLPEGEFTFEELRDQLRGRLSRGSGVRRLVEELRKSTYVEIRL